MCAALIAGAAVFAAPHAVAAPRLLDTPAPIQERTQAMASADNLPTVQIESGVVWDQAIVGNTVFAGGNFSYTRPPGAPIPGDAMLAQQRVRQGCGPVNTWAQRALAVEGGTDRTPRCDLLAYDVRTGELLPFAPHFNGEVKVIRATADGRILFVGGAFTQVNGQARGNIAAFDIRTGELLPFAPVVAGGGVHAIEVLGDVVYVGGQISSVNGHPRSHLGAVSLSGATVNWTPAADVQVDAMTLTPAKDSLIIGGRFGRVGPYGGSLVSSPGMAALDLTSGARLPWAISDPATPLDRAVRNGGSASKGIWDLSVDDQRVIGSAWSFDVTAGFEGAFAVDPNGGAAIWLGDGEGDTYGVYSDGDTVYATSHSHNMAPIGAYPNFDTPSGAFQFATAFTAEPRGVSQGGGRSTHAGAPAPALVHWYPKFFVGTNFTGLSQAALSVQGNDEYVVVAGEFQGVNGTSNYGLTRFGRGSTGGTSSGPRLSADSWAPTGYTPLQGRGRVTIWPNFDRDDRALTYELYRVGTPAPVARRTVSASSWLRSRDAVILQDTSQVPGAFYDYQVKAIDRDGNSALSSVIRGQGSTQAVPAYARSVSEDAPQIFWRLGPKGPDAASDWATGYDGNYFGGVNASAAGVISHDPTPSGKAMAFTGATQGFVSTKTDVPAARTATIEAWVRTTTELGGMIAGLGAAGTGTSATSSSALYMRDNGTVTFGVATDATVTTRVTVNDGIWHHIVGTQTAKGLVIYVDGEHVGTNAAVTSASIPSGYWRVGGDTLSGWPGRPTSDYFTGVIDEFAVYDHALSKDRIVQHLKDSGSADTVGSGGALPQAVPGDPYATAVAAADPFLYWRMDDAIGTNNAVHDTSTRATPGFMVGPPVSFGHAGIYPGSSAARFRFGGAITSRIQLSNPQEYTVQAWFRSTSTRGGRIIGFSENPFGYSARYDRHVHLRTDGRIQFGVWSGGQHVIVSPEAYNNGAWHQVTATMGSAGMRLYVDGLEVAANPAQTISDTEAIGYWKVGEDQVWGPSSPTLDGLMDDVAVFRRAMPAEEIANLYRIGQGMGAPTAQFTHQVSGSNVTFDAASSRPAGEHAIVSYDWDFGDGATGTGVNPSHEYDEAGVYRVTVRVTADDGLFSLVTGKVVAEAAHRAPQAAFTATPRGRTVAFDASGSSADEGRNLTAYAWDFGDGSTSASAAAEHVFAAPGDYPVTLTVTDDTGATGELTTVVTVAPVIAADGFGRERTTWGAADIGGSWTTDGAMTVSGGTGLIELKQAGTTRNVSLSGSTATDFDVTVDLALDQAARGGATMVSQTVRHTAEGYYAAKLVFNPDATVSVSLIRYAQGTESFVKSVNLKDFAYVPGQVLRVRVQAIGTGGSTALRTKVYPASVAEPDAWLLSAEDSTPALQGPGHLGLRSYLSGRATSVPQTVRVDNVLAVGAEGLPGVGFTAASQGAMASFEAGAAASVLDRAIVAHEWDFGDGTGASGRSVTHPYAKRGSYSVTLRVIDESGRAWLSTQQITVTHGTAEPGAGAVMTSAVRGLQVDFDGSGSALAGGERVTSYSWDFGDGQSSTEVAPRHTYRMAGTYRVTLTVQGPSGAQATVADQVTVSPAILSDAFEREGATWGRADSGGVWKADKDLSTSGGMGVIAISQAGQTRVATLPEVSVPEADMSVDVSIDRVPQGGSMMLSSMVRQVGDSYYATKLVYAVDGSVTVSLVRSIAGTETFMRSTVIPAAACPPGTMLRVRTQAITAGGGTALAAKVYRADAPEPAQWLLTAEDAAAELQKSGTVGLRAYLSAKSVGVPPVVRVDNIAVAPPLP